MLELSSTSTSTTAADSASASERPRLYYTGRLVPTRRPTKVDARKLAHALEYLHMAAARVRSRCEAAGEQAFANRQPYTTHADNGKTAERMEDAAAAALLVLGFYPPPSAGATVVVDDICHVCAARVEPGKPHLRHHHCAECGEPIAPDDIYGVCKDSPGARFCEGCADFDLPPDEDC